MSEFTQEKLKIINSLAKIDFTVIFRVLCRDTYIEIEGRKDDYFRTIRYFPDGTQTETFSEMIPSAKREKRRKVEK